MKGIRSAGEPSSVISHTSQKVPRAIIIPRYGGKPGQCRARHPGPFRKDRRTSQITSYVDAKIGTESQESHSRVTQFEESETSLEKLPCQAQGFAIWLSKGEGDSQINELTNQLLESKTGTGMAAISSSNSAGLGFTTRQETTLLSQYFPASHLPVIEKGRPPGYVSKLHPTKDLLQYKLN